MPDHSEFYEAVSVIKELLLAQKPARILIASPDAERYAIYLAGLFGSVPDGLTMDQMVLSPAETASSGFFGRVYTLENVLRGEVPEKYDLVFLTDFFDQLDVASLCDLLENMLKIVKQSVLIAMPILSAKRLESGDSGKLSRKFHPVVFENFDFSFFEIQTSNGGYQFYNIFKSGKVKTGLQAENSRPASSAGRKLKIAYLLPHKGLTGGMKCLLEQMRQLQRRGHCVYAIYRSRPGQTDKTAVPAWSDLDPHRDLSGEIVLEPDESYLSCLDGFDVVMIGFMNQLQEFANYAGRAAVVYWEQGYEALYGDYGRLISPNDTNRVSIQALYGINVRYLAVSNLVAQVLQSKFGIAAQVLPNGIDTQFYHPCESKSFEGTILLVGNPMLPFKQFLFALRVLEQVWRLGGRFKVQWACQVKPTVQNLSYPVEYYELPSQEALAELYRKADLFLSTSLYESFPMPPFEAMASGLPVVSVDSGGVRTYAVNGENILLTEQGDLETAAACILRLLKDAPLRERLSRAGRETAQQFSFSRIAAIAERYFYQFVAPAAVAETDGNASEPEVVVLNRLPAERFVPDPARMTERGLGFLLTRISCGREEENFAVLKQALAEGRFSEDQVEQKIEASAFCKEAAYNAVGVAYYTLEQKQTAIRFFADAYAANRGYRDAAFNLAYGLVAFKKGEEALRVIHGSGCLDEEMCALADAARLLETQSKMDGNGYGR